MALKIELSLPIKSYCTNHLLNKNVPILIVFDFLTLEQPISFFINNNCEKTVD